MNIRELQIFLAGRGFDPGKIDGIDGPKTQKAWAAWQADKAAVKAFQASRGLYPDSIVGPRTLAAIFPPVMTSDSEFDKVSAARLAAAHPLLQKVMNEARQSCEFRILDSQRGKAAQEKAFRDGNSKAHFGQSPHNWTPAIAVDAFPAPYNWSNTFAFDNMAKIVMDTAHRLDVPLRWGGDWNMDGNPSDGWDKPHFELHPWREWAKQCKPYNG